MARSFQKYCRISQKGYLILIDCLFCIPSRKFLLGFYLKDVIFFFLSSLTGSVLLVMLFKIDMLVYVTAGKISVPGKVVLIWESCQVNVFAFMLLYSMSNLNNYTLILCYLCNSLHLTSSTSFKGFLTLSNVLIRNAMQAVDLSKSHKVFLFQV